MKQKNKKKRLSFACHPPFITFQILCTITICFTEQQIHWGMQYAFVNTSYCSLPNKWKADRQEEEKWLRSSRCVVKLCSVWPFFLHQFYMNILLVMWDVITIPVRMLFCAPAICHGFICFWMDFLSTRRAGSNKSTNS